MSINFIEQGINMPKRLLFLSFLIGLTFGISVTYAETKIAILAFELKDLTLAPGIPAEIKRTASIKPLLSQELSRAGYKILEVDEIQYQQLNAGPGYLFEHHDVAARLGEKVAADYVLVGRLHKPSFLFAYLMGHLVRVSDGRLVGNYISEAKGPHVKLTKKTVESLAVKIDRDLDKRYTPPKKNGF